jgi:hypothetical protein
MIRDALQTIGQNKSRWAHGNQCPHLRCDRAREGPLQKPKNATRWDQRQKYTGSEKYEGLLRWRVFFGIDGGLRSLNSRVFKLGSFHRLKLGIKNLDSSRIKIIIFISLIRFNHSICNARPIRPHKIKRIAYNYRLRAVDSKTHSQTCYIDLTQVNVTTEDRSQQSSTFTHVYKGPVPKYPTHAYSNHKQENKS